MTQSSSPATADVVVIGGGIVGAATGWQLGERLGHQLDASARVVVLERSTVASGGTGKSSGIVRCHYGVASLAVMAWKGLNLFENAAERLGTDVGFTRTGYVVGVGPGNEAALAANLQAQATLGVQTGPIDATEVAALWPQLRLDDFAAFGWEPRGGYGDGHRTAAGFATAARRAGVQVRQSAPVARILTAGGAVSGVQLVSGEVIATRAVVLAAGPWSVPLAAEHGIELPIRVHREELVLIDPGTELGPVPVLSDLVSLQYVRSEPGGRLLFGNSDLSVPAPADPDGYSDRAGAATVETVAAKMTHRFPGLPQAAVAGSYAGCYDVTPDFNPVISLTPVPGLVVAAGFSGHGFKISAAVGELAADLVLNGDSGDPQVPAADFRLARFAENDPLLSPHPYLGAGEMR